MDKIIEEHIKSEEETLDWLMRRCWSRYHVFDNKTKCGDKSQVKTLLNKVDNLIAFNCPYEVNHTKLKSTEESKKADKENGSSTNWAS